jgi:hypothetical protein
MRWRERHDAAHRPGAARPAAAETAPRPARGVRVVIVVALSAGTFVLGHIVRYDYAAIYFNLPEIRTSHHGGLSSPGPQRHLAARGTVRGRGPVQRRLGPDRVLQLRPALATKPPGWFARRVCRPLLIRHERPPRQTLWCLALSWWWIIVFAAPVFLLGIWLLTVSRLNSNQIGETITGGVAARRPEPAHHPAAARARLRVLVPRRPHRGQGHRIPLPAADHQGAAGRQAHQAGVVDVHIFPFLRWRFDWDRAHWHGELEQNQHTVLHRTILAMGILLFALLA